MTNELTHHGIKGQKWGVRRFQKKDGTLTPAGKKRYNDDDLMKKYGELEDQMTYGKHANPKKNAAIQKRMREIENELNAESNAKKAAKLEKAKAKIEKQKQAAIGKAEVKAIKKTYAAEYRAGHSFITNLWGDYTGTGARMYADMKYNTINVRGNKFNEDTWEDE